MRSGGVCPEHGPYDDSWRTACGCPRSVHTYNAQGNVVKPAPPASPADERCPTCDSDKRDTFASRCRSWAHDDWHEPYWRHSGPHKHEAVPDAAPAPASAAGREEPVAWGVVTKHGRAICAFTTKRAADDEAALRNEPVLLGPCVDELHQPFRVVPLYTRAAPAHAGTARAEALEEAAKECCRLADLYERLGSMPYRIGQVDGCRTAAQNIRALASAGEGGKGGA